MANLSNINNKFLVTTGGNVLIGQTSAVGTAKLQVTGEVRVYTGSNLGYLGVDSGNSYVYFGTNTSGYGLSLQTGGIDRININDAGNVFISTPITNAFYGLSLTYNSNNTADFTVNQATGQIKIGGVATGYYPTFYSAGAERMRIDTSGNATFTGNIITTGTNFIGKASTSSYLPDDGVFGGKITNGGGFKITTQAIDTLTLSAVGGNMTVRGEGTFGGLVQVNTSNEKGTQVNSTVADKLIYSQINALSSTTGTITGAAALELVGQANASGHGRHAWIGAEGTPNTTFETKLKFKIRGETASGYDWAGSAEAPTIMTLEGSGNVGIGKTSPAKKLDVEGNIRAIKTGGTAAAEIDVTSGATWRLRSNPTSGTNNYGLDIIKGGAGTDIKMSIDSNGNVGIGTASPGAKLEVTGTTTKLLSLTQTLTSTSTSLATMRSFYTFGITQFRGGVDKGLYMSNITNNIPGIQVVDSSDNAGGLSIQPYGGNVGIGNAAPASKLHTGDIVGGSFLPYLNGTTQAFATSTNVITVHDSAALGTNTAAGLMLVNNNGANDAPSPLIAFSARSTSNTYNQTYAAIWGEKDSTGADSNWNTGSLVFATSTSTGPYERMRINPVGGVGIGVSSNIQGALHVVGRVNTNRIVSANFIAGNIRSNLTTTSYLLLVDLNVAAGFSLAGKLNAASYTTWNVSDIYVRKNYNSASGVASITGISKSGSNLSIVDISHSSGRFIAIKLNGDPEIDVMWTGYRLNALFGSDGIIATLTSGVTENSVYASY